MNRKKAIILISMLESFFFGFSIVLYMTGTIKMYSFIALIAIVSVIASLALVLAIRKLPPVS